MGPVEIAALDATEVSCNSPIDRLCGRALGAGAVGLRCVPMAPIDGVWGRIIRSSGDVFHQQRGTTFTCSVSGATSDLDTVDHDLSRRHIRRESRHDGGSAGTGSIHDIGAGEDCQDTARPLPEASNWCYRNRSPSDCLSSARMASDDGIGRSLIRDGAAGKPNPARTTRQQPAATRPRSTPHPICRRLLPGDNQLRAWRTCWAHLSVHTAASTSEPSDKWCRTPTQTRR